jgi:hypothetical protein
MEKKIIQVIPADGWLAVLAKRNEDGTVGMVPMKMTFWGLREDGIVSGYAAANIWEPCDEAPDFAGFIHESEPIEKLSTDAEQAVRFMERRQRKLNPPAVESGDRIGDKRKGG